MNVDQPSSVSMVPAEQTYTLTLSITTIRPLSTSIFSDFQHFLNLSFKLNLQKILKLKKKHKIAFKIVRQQLQKTCNYNLFDM